uniref:Taste receptor type 2 n=1 Tax=Xenopus tropicalis TaxID=8364 RepID=A0A6I8R2L9_XENTR
CSPSLLHLTVQYCASKKRNFQKMLSALQVIRTVILIVTWPCGTILNSSIIAVYLSDWKKGVKLGECDQISLSMGCTNLLLQCFITLGVAFISYGMYLPFAFSIFLSFWLTAGLSVCYCLRLANPLPKCFLQLKRRLSRIVTPLLLWSVAISFTVTFSNIILYTGTNQNLTILYHNNKSNVNDDYSIPAITFGISLPSIITSICILLSLISLLRHIRRMKQNPQVRSPQLKNLIRACRTMFLLMTLNFLFFLIIFSLMVPLYDVGTVWNMVRSSGIVLIPSGQAVVLIFGNSKLLEKNIFIFDRIVYRRGKIILPYIYCVKEHYTEKLFVV